MTIPEQTQWPTPTGERVRQHEALELATALGNYETEHVPNGPYGYSECYYRTQNGSCDLDNAVDAIRRQHALIVQMREALESAVQTAKFEKHASRPWRNDADSALTAANDYLEQS
jgi:hypothetical protein